MQKRRPTLDEATAEELRAALLAAVLDMGPPYCDDNEQRAIASSYLPHSREPLTKGRANGGDHE